MLPSTHCPLKNSENDWDFKKQVYNKIQTTTIYRAPLHPPRRQKKKPETSCRRNCAKNEHLCWDLETDAYLKRSEFRISRTPCCTLDAREGCKWTTIFTFFSCSPSICGKFMSEVMTDWPPERCGDRPMQRRHEQLAPSDGCAPELGFPQPLYGHGGRDSVEGPRR